MSLWAAIGKPRSSSFRLRSLATLANRNHLGTRWRSGWSSEVPAELFGHEGYGRTVGRLAAPSFIARALGPIGLTLCASPPSGFDFSVPLLIAVAFLALVTYVMALRPKRVRTSAT